MNKALLVFTSALIILLLTGSSMAGIRVTNAIIRDEIIPGGHFENMVTISIKQSDQPVNFTANVVGYGQTLDGGNIEQDPSEQNSFMAGFIKASPSTFHLDPGENQTIIISGDVPMDVGVGAKFALLNVKSQPVASKNIGIVLAVDVPILLTISGTEQKITGEISSLKLADPATLEHQNFTAIFNNTGNTYFKVQSKAELKDDTGKVVADVSNPLDSTSIIPPNARRIEFNLSPSTPLAPGKYTLIATMSLEDGAVLATKDASFEIKS